MEPRPTPIEPASGVAVDPVCGMSVRIDGAPHTSVHEGTTYYFCAKGCRLDFEEDPQRYLAPGYQPSMGGH
jgi:Cu+-exporting ATPase